MLTKDLLLYRIRKGQVKPTFIDASSPELLSLSASMLAIPATSTGTERSTIEELLSARASDSSAPKIANGLAKLVTDRLTFEEGSEEAPVLRRQAFDAAAIALRGLPDNATPAELEIALASHFARPLETVRDSLYADHPDNRRLLSWEPLEPDELLHRYNLAQVQGLLLRADRVTVRALAPTLLQVRKLLRWMKFCRLVAEVKSEGADWTIDVEGPAKILAMQKRYGMQLAIFAQVIPLLSRWELRAEIRFARGEPVTLELDQESPLVAPRGALGYVPPEIDIIAKKLDDETWALDLTPTPRTVGLGSLCVPDMTLKRRDGAHTIHFEFFHRWHRHALARRLQDLRSRPDPVLFLGVEEPLAHDPELRAQLEAHPQVLLFKGFPSERKIRAILARFEG